MKFSGISVLYDTLTQGGAWLYTVGKWLWQSTLWCCEIIKQSCPNYGRCSYPCSYIIPHYINLGLLKWFNSLIKSHTLLFLYDRINYFKSPNFTFPLISLFYSQLLHCAFSNSAFSNLLLGVHVVFKTFTLPFGRLRQRMLLKCVPHVQHDYISSFNQSNHCFPASSLPLPSSLLKLPKDDDNGNDDSTEQWSEWLNEEK